MNEDDEQLFRDAYSDVDPLKATSVKASVKVAAKPTPGTLHRREAAQQLDSDPNTLSDEHIPCVLPYDPISYRRDGVQHGVFKKLRLGLYDLEARLDLHQLSLQQARNAVFYFIRESHQYGLRTLIILHGKGARNTEKPALLKSATAYWLCQMDEILAYHSAMQHHGGTGAVYVLLRKSEQSKRENRELHGGRGA